MDAETFDDAIYEARRTSSWDEDMEAQELVREHGALTLDQIAGHFGLSKERIRQIQNEALKKLSERGGLDAFLGHQRPASFWEQITLQSGGWDGDDRRNSMLFRRRYGRKAA